MVTDQRQTKKRKTILPPRRAKSASQGCKGVRPPTVPQRGHVWWHLHPYTLYPSKSREGKIFFFSWKSGLVVTDQRQTKKREKKSSSQEVEVLFPKDRLCVLAKSGPLSFRQRTCMRKSKFSVTAARNDTLLMHRPHQPSSMSSPSQQRAPKRKTKERLDWA